MQPGSLKLGTPSGQDTGIMREIPKRDIHTCLRQRGALEAQFQWTRKLQTAEIRQQLNFDVDLKGPDVWD